MQWHINVFNHIIIDLLRLDVKIKDEDLVTTLTYWKETTSLKEVTIALTSHYP